MVGGIVEEIECYIAHAERQIDQIHRRVIKGEKIPHEEKVFSVFEEHTEWISKGKAGVPVELGLRVCVLEDTMGFILHHQVMEKQTDDKVAVLMVEETQARFPRLGVCSFDKGFPDYPQASATLRSRSDMGGVRTATKPRRGIMSSSLKRRLNR